MIEYKGFKKGEQIYYAGSLYNIAEFKEFPHGIMIGIKDEFKTNHIDYINPDSVSKVNPCYACQGGGCPVCSGQGIIIN